MAVSTAVDVSAAPVAVAAGDAPTGDEAIDATDAAAPQAPQALTRDIAIKRLLAAHEAYYDVTRDYAFEGRQFAGYAEFHSHGEQYVLSRRAKLWEVDAHEYIFFDSVAHLTDAYLVDAVQFVETKGIAKVKPVPNHMQSFLTLVIVADEVDDAAAKTARHQRFRKNFALGIRGWADLRLAIVNLSDNGIITNGMGKELRETLEANVSLPTQG